MADGDSGRGRLTLALLLALVLHGALLWGVPRDWRRVVERPVPVQFEMRLTLPEMRPPPAPPAPEPMAWLPPASPRAFVAALPPPEPDPVPEPPPPPVIQPPPSPPLPRTAKPAPKPAVSVHLPPLKKTKIPPNPPLPKGGTEPLQPAVPARPAAPPPPSARPAENRPPPRRPAASLDSAALLGQIAGLETAQQRRESTAVRAKRVGLTDTRSAAGFYAADWARKVTRVGEMNFPDAARRLSTSAGPLLDVVIRADGQLQEVRMVRSSGYPELDRAARRIVELAAPYPPFPPELRRDADLLRIAAPWRFDPGGKIRTR